MKAEKGTKLTPGRAELLVWHGNYRWVWLTYGALIVEIRQERYGKPLRVRAPHVLLSSCQLTATGLSMLHALLFTANDILNDWRLHDYPWASVPRGGKTITVGKFLYLDKRRDEYK